jgi:hypothetical protein
LKAIVEQAALFAAMRLSETQDAAAAAPYFDLATRIRIWHRSPLSKLRDLRLEPSPPDVPSAVGKHIR